jgi:hypothetical protein
VRTLVRLGRVADAQQALASAESLLPKLRGARALFEAELLLASARVDMACGKPDVAYTKSERGCAALHACVGRTHPATMDALLLVGELDVARADLPRATAAIEAALEVGRANQMEEHPLLIQAHSHLALLRDQSGNPDAAALHREHVRALRDRRRATRG